MTQRNGITADMLAILSAPTPSEEVKQRQGPGGRMLDYIDARFVMDRLDQIGPENWQDQYQDRADGSVRAGIGVLIEGEWVWKWDVGDPSDIESNKGAYSEAFKRAGVKWGIARDLYGHGPHTSRSAPVPPSGSVVAPSTAAGRVPPRPAATTVPPEPDWMEPSAVETARTARGATQTADDGFYVEYGTCPDHNATWRHVPAGVSKATGKPYGEFWACPERGCKEKPAQRWVDLAKERAA